MHPILIDLGRIQIRSYGFMLALSFLLMRDLVTDGAGAICSHLTDADDGLRGTRASFRSESTQAAAKGAS